MEFQNILFETSDGIARITLNRPDAGNALTPASCRELLDAAIECEENRSIRAVLITATGKMFCAGGDLKAFHGSGEALPKVLNDMTIHFHAALSRLNRMRAPVVTAVNGVAAGAGLSLAACGDLVLAAESAKFTVAYTAVGLSPDGGATYFLPRLIGLRRAQELMLTNRRLTAQEALDWGLVTRVVPDDDLSSEAQKLVRDLASGPTAAFGTVKQLLLDTFSNTLETQMEIEGRGIVARGRSADGREGISAFLSKRRPAFRGD